MGIEAVILMRGLNGKTRLGIENGGFFDVYERERLVGAMLVDVYKTLESSGVFDSVSIVSKYSAVNKDFDAFCKAEGLDVCPLLYDDINEAISYVQFRYICGAGLMLIGGDVPLACKEDFEVMKLNLTELVKMYEEGVVVAKAQDGGNPALMLSRSNLFPIKLGMVPSNFEYNTGVMRERGVPYKVLEGRNVCKDIDYPKDVVEVYRQLEREKPDSRTFKVLDKLKGKFLMPVCQT